MKIINKNICDFCKNNFNFEMSKFIINPYLINNNKWQFFYFK